MFIIRLVILCGIFIFDNFNNFQLNYNYGNLKLLNNECFDLFLIFKF